MKCDCLPNDSNRFATNLRHDKVNSKIIWDNSRGQDVLIIQTPFGRNALEMMDEITAAIEIIQEIPNSFIEIKKGLRIRMVSSDEKIRNQGLSISEEACTYTVIACNIEDGILHLYMPKEQAMISPYINVPMKVKISILEDYEVSGFLKKKEIQSGYYTVTFEDAVKIEERYVDGSIGYIINDLEIPVTKDMIKAGTVFIKTNVRPEMVSNSNGLVIE